MDYNKSSKIISSCDSYQYPVTTTSKISHCQVDDDKKKKESKSDESKSDEKKSDEKKKNEDPESCQEFGVVYPEGVIRLYMNIKSIESCQVHIYFTRPKMFPKIHLI